MVLIIQSVVQMNQGDDLLLGGVSTAELSPQNHQSLEHFPAQHYVHWHHISQDRRRLDEKSPL
ncbi:UNVERIFIED_CONTAM: hypothetical protein FKN15_051933 [Acipenser sinensis]